MPLSYDDRVRASKFLSYVLRHRPDSIGLALDGEGWAEIDELIARSQGSSLPLTVEIIREVVETNDKRRFAISADGRRIRANQGHSIDIDPALEPRVPPDVLFHGTASRFVESIRAQGLIRGSRLHVHLAIEETTAIKVGQRHGVPVVLRVAAGRMVAAGFESYRSDNGVWLTEHVPVEYLEFPAR